MTTLRCMSFAEAAARCNVVPKTLRKWVRRGGGPVVTRIGGRVLVREDHLREFLDQHADERAA